ncbi:hypothetical protein [Clostridium sp. AN503]|uniref:DUF6906 family protein n=1 Tax=Clostridium sp. AN503 TaxID=3160598 RepID=UPI003458708B
MGKSRAKRPTREQKIHMDRAGLIARNWLVIRLTPEELRLVSKGTGRSRTLRKGG